MSDDVVILIYFAIALIVGVAVWLVDSNDDDYILYVSSGAFWPLIPLALLLIPVIGTLVKLKRWIHRSKT